MKRKRGLHFGREKKKVNIPIVKEVVSWVIEIVIVLVIAFVFVYYIGLRTSVVGQSMAPVLENKQEILVNRFIYSLTSPKFTSMENCLRKKESVPRFWTQVWRRKKFFWEKTSISCWEITATTAKTAGMPISAA